MDAAVVDKRAFLPRPILEDSLTRILQAARMTGRSKNREPNRLVVVRERERAAALLGSAGDWLAAAAAMVIARTDRHEFLRADGS